MGVLDGLLSRLMLRVTLALTLLITAAALSVVGLVWLVNALTLWLEPLTGAAAAHALAGLTALIPLLLIFTLLARFALQRQHHGLGEGLRQSIRTNPWESLGVAFFLGFTQQGRHPDRAHVFMELLRQPRRQDSSSGENTDPEDNQIHSTGR